MINPADQNVFWSVFLVTVTLFWVSPANVASKCKYDCCYKPDAIPTSDSGYVNGSCDSAFMKRRWKWYEFDKTTWDDGFGYNTPCMSKKPMSRIFNAIYILDYSAPNYPTDIKDMQGSILRIGGNYAIQQLNDVKGRCGSGKLAGQAGLNMSGASFIDEWTKFFWPFFYGAPAVWRAGIIIHEARHADGKPHNGNGNCKRGSGCDYSFAHNGSNTWEASWLCFFYADAQRTTPAVRRRARAAGNHVLRRTFTQKPDLLCKAYNH